VSGFPFITKCFICVIVSTEEKKWCVLIHDLMMQINVRNVEGHLCLPDKHWTSPAKIIATIR